MTPTALALNASNTDTGRTQIHDPRLLTLARSVWGVLVVLILALYIAAVPLELNTLRTICQAEPCGVTQLHPDEATGLQGIGISIDSYAWYSLSMTFISYLAFVFVAAIIFWRKSDDWMALFVSLMLVAFGAAVAPVIDYLVLRYPALHLAFALVQTIAYGSVVLFPYLFPDGQFVPSWTRWLAVACIALILIDAILSTTLLDVSFFPLLLFIIGIGVVAQVYRYQRISTRIQRQQTKWVVLGLAAMFLGTFIGIMPLFFFPSLVQPGLSHVLYNMIRVPFFAVIPLELLPITIAISLLRYRLWEVDLVVNRGLVYGTLTVALVAVFFGGLLLLQSLLSAILGSQQTTMAAMLAAVIVVGLFNPTRRRLQHFVDRRFYRLNIPLDQLRASPPVIANQGALSGTTLGSYQVLEPIGKGGMGEVYKGFQTGLKRPVAIKILPDQLAQETEFRVRFEREAKTVAALKHPNIVSVFDFGEADGKYYMVMEYIDGQDLGNHLKAVGRLPVDEARLLVQDIAAALDYAHSQGLVHRDVKPSNVMLQKATITGATHATPRAILMDFGIAKIVGGNTGLTGTGMVGTLDYVAPEQIMSAREVDRRADIYALGVMVYQMFTGQLPFVGNNPARLVFAHLQQPAPDPRDVVPELPVPIAKAVLKALAKKPEDRFPTAGEFAATLV